MSNLHKKEMISTKEKIKYILIEIDFKGTVRLKRDLSWIQVIVFWTFFY